MLEPSFQGTCKGCGKSSYAQDCCDTCYEEIETSDYISYEDHWADAYDDVLEEIKET